MQSISTFSPYYSRQDEPEIVYKLFTKLCQNTQKLDSLGAVKASPNFANETALAIINLPQLAQDYEDLKNYYFTAYPDSMEKAEEATARVTDILGLSLEHFIDEQVKKMRPLI